MRVVKAILLIIILGALTPFIWVLAPFYFESEEDNDNSK